jgi:FkbM family methyltransferase
MSLKLKSTASFFVRSGLSLIRKNRYVRLSPNYTGKIYFFDKKLRSFFYVLSRNKIDSLTADQIYTNADYDLRFMIRYQELMEKFLKAESVGQKNLIIDCGANIGLSARYFAEEFPGALVVAIEPDASNFKMAVRNCEHLSNVVIKNCAIGSKKGFVKIANQDADSNAFTTIRENSDQGIEIVTVPEILSDYDGHQLFLAKIDIEGFESDLFQQETDWVKSAAIIIIELHDWLFPRRGTSINFLRVISEEDRDFIFKGENIFSIRNL